MARWEDLSWDDRILNLTELTEDEKNRAIIVIGNLGEPRPARQEVAVPKDKAVAIDSIRRRLAGEPYTYASLSI